MQDIDYQPRLSRWSQVWRFGVVIVISGFAWAPMAEYQWKHNHVWLAIDLSVGAASLVLVWWRRRFPVAVALITAMASAVSGTAAGPATLALVSMATRRRWREILPVTVVTFASAIVMEWLNKGNNDPAFITGPVIVAAIAVTVGWGLYIGSRRELLKTLRERADSAEADQVARATQARTNERARIAREMHDVLAHRISLVTMHAGALTFRRDLDAEQMRDTAAIIQENSHQALVELRAVLGILREEPGDAAPELPQPSAEDLPDLILEARRSGMRIETERGFVLDDVPEMLGRTLYRVVQEGLTNARKHAPDTRVTVNLDGGPADGLTVEVRNPLRIGSAMTGAPASGLGLIGLTERTTLAGGHMSHLVSADREFVLRAWLPWPS